MKKISLFLFLIFAVSCSSQDDNLYEFDPRTIEEKEINLSEIANSSSYIPLDNSIPIGLIYNNIEFIRNTIYLSVRDIGILAFSREGKLLRKIGSVGRGPGEYIYYFLFTVDDKTENVYVIDIGGVIKVFSKSGRFLRSFSIKEFGQTEKIKFYNSRLFVLFASQFSGSENEWILFDTLGNVVKKQARKLPPFSTNWGSSAPTYEYGNTLAYFNIFSDTVFSISPDLKEIPTMIVSHGEHRLPRSNLSPEQMMSKKYFFLEQIQETVRYFILKYSISGSNLAIINKTDHSTKSVDLKYSNSIYNNGIINDIDGGCFFVPEYYYSESGYEYLLHILQPQQIKARVNSNDFKNSISTDPYKKKEFEKLANSLDEADNPVLMLVRLKK